jgi:ribonuclease HIII
LDRTDWLKNLCGSKELRSSQRAVSKVIIHLRYRLKKTKTSILIFSTGKMVCTGANSERMTRKGIHKVLRELKARDIIVRGRPEITVQNIVTSAELGGGRVRVVELPLAR